MFVEINMISASNNSANARTYTLTHSFAEASCVDETHFGLFKAATNKKKQKKDQLEGRYN